MPDLDPQMSPGQHAAKQVCGSMADRGTDSQGIVEGRVIEQSQYLPRPWKARQAERHRMEGQMWGLGPTHPSFSPVSIFPAPQLIPWARALHANPGSD